MSDNQTPKELQVPKYAVILAKVIQKTGEQQLAIQDRLASVMSPSPATTKSKPDEPAFCSAPLAEQLLALVKEVEGIIERNEIILGCLEI
jgi:hypothetical protein